MPRCRNPKTGRFMKQPSPRLLPDALVKRLRQGPIVARHERLGQEWQFVIAKKTYVLREPPEGEM